MYIENSVPITGIIQDTWIDLSLSTLSYCLICSIDRSDQFDSICCKQHKQYSPLESRSLSSCKITRLDNTSVCVCVRACIEAPPRGKGFSRAQEFMIGTENYYCAVSRSPRSFNDISDKLIFIRR